ncbi:MAG: amidohydrolase [Peptoniphilus sp.]|nr:amidohydrolase [Peptoniphilus sp.]
MKIDEILERAKSLRKTLHDNAEPSNKEFKTKQILMNFLRENTSVEIVDFERFFYAVHREEGATKTIAFRADMDAIVDGEGKAFHGCGHDGHSTILCSLALCIEKEQLGKNIIFLFQQGEENGTGAKDVMPHLKPLNIDYIFGLHNLPGIEKNRAVIKEGVFFCASKGVNIDFTGRQTHASTPELGVNPAYAISKIVEKIEDFSKFRGYGVQGEFSSMVLATVISTSVGAKGSYGVSPGQGNLQLTLRAARSEDLQKLEKIVIETVRKEAEAYDLDFEVSYNDEFPDTTNSADSAKFMEKLLSKRGFDYVKAEEPYRTSEDFGVYLKNLKGHFFGVGSGVEQPPLHDVNFEFPDDIVQRSVEIYRAIIEEI